MDGCLLAWWCNFVGYVCTCLTGRSGDSSSRAGQGLLMLLLLVVAVASFLQLSVASA